MKVVNSNINSCESCPYEAIDYDRLGRKFFDCCIIDKFKDKESAGVCVHKPVDDKNRIKE